MTPLEETLKRLASESARDLAELGVRPADEAWIRAHAETIASLAGEKRSKVVRFFERLAARIVRRLR